MAKRRSEIGKKGKHGREGVDVSLTETAKRRRRATLMVATIIMVLIIILASVYYFLLPSEETEEEGAVLTADSTGMSGYPNQTITFEFTLYNPDKEADTFWPRVLGLPSDWEISLPNTISLDIKEEKSQEFSIIPSLATAENRTYSFMLNVTSANTQHTYTLDYEITVFRLDIYLGLTSDTLTIGGNPGDNLTFDIALFNPPIAADEFILSIYGLPSDWEYFYPSNISINASESKDETFSIIPSPSTALNKTYSFTFNATSQSTPYTYSLQYNLTIFRTYNVELIAYNNSHDADPGRFTNYVILVKNNGNAEDTISFSYNGSQLPANWSLSFEFDSMDIPAFGSEVMICNITTSSTTSQGRYDIDIIGQGGNKATDSVRLNTTLTLDFDAETVSVGNKTQIDYIGIFPDGRIFDTSESDAAYNDNLPKIDGFSVRPPYSPLKTYIGPSDPDTGDDYIQVYPGFWEGAVGMKAGETKVVRLPSEKGDNDGLVRLFEITLVSIDG